MKEAKSDKKKKINDIKFNVHLTKQHEKSKWMTTIDYADELPIQ